MDPFKGKTFLFTEVLGEPELVFAWWPVKCFDGKWAWFCFVWRRLCICQFYFGGYRDDPFYQYAKLAP